eukprot:TRINITY_DN1017_c0_g1_i2.p1 TRINITY_DN1017_c0_g1~~TRINITY_DN1017_c0_g1_i2.p1  ORF type:complete len:258 (-),score=63.06 TRINITY_DN1017_c0_g1_i2:51-824(-)
MIGSTNCFLVELSQDSIDFMKSMYDTALAVTMSKWRNNYEEEWDPIMYSLRKKMIRDIRKMKVQRGTKQYNYLRLTAETERVDEAILQSAKRIKILDDELDHKKQQLDVAKREFTKLKENEHKVNRKLERVRDNTDNPNEDYNFILPSNDKLVNDEVEIILPNSHHEYESSVLNNMEEDVSDGINQVISLVCNDPVNINTVERNLAKPLRLNEIIIDALPAKIDESILKLPDGPTPSELRRMSTNLDRSSEVSSGDW